MQEPRSFRHGTRALEVLSHTHPKMLLFMTDTDVECSHSSEHA
jgi:hypothetical protein